MGRTTAVKSITELQGRERILAFLECLVDFVHGAPGAEIDGTREDIVDMVLDDLGEFFHQGVRSSLSKSVVVAINSNPCYGLRVRAASFGDRIIISAA